MAKSGLLAHSMQKLMDIMVGVVSRALRESKVRQFRILDGNFGCNFLIDETPGNFKFEFLAGKSLSVHIFTIKCCM